MVLSKVQQDDDDHPNFSGEEDDDAEVSMSFDQQFKIRQNTIQEERRSTVIRVGQKDAINPEGTSQTETKQKQDPLEPINDKNIEQKHEI